MKLNDLHVYTNAEKPRLLVLTDIGGDPDDQQAMIRLMCYSNEFDVEGLIATSRMGHGHDVRPDLIQEIVSAYGQVRNNLLIHKGGYPTADYLHGVIKSGQSTPDTIGAGNDTQGSEWIVLCADKVDSRPLNITIWGGATDLAQALWKIKNTRNIEDFNTFVSNLRVYSISKQDEGIDWILENVPNLFMILSNNEPGARASAYRGMYLGGDETLTSTDWINSNVKLNHGPLGALYPMETYTNPNPYGCLKEGDVPSWFYFLSGVMGLSDPMKPCQGGWGGRFQSTSNNLWVDETDSYNGTTDSRVTVWRWRKDFQNDFAARMDWCVKPYEEVNHHPIAVVKGELNKKAVSEDMVLLDATDSSDPDGDTLNYEWMYYKEAGTYGEYLIINDNTSEIADFIAPIVSSPKTIHIILKVTDNGLPALTSYQRVIVTVEPNRDVGN